MFTTSFFGSKNKSSTPSPPLVDPATKSIQTLRDNLEILETKQKIIQNEIDKLQTKLTVFANLEKNLLAKKKDEATAIIKRRKLLETSFNTNTQLIIQLETQIHHIEMSKTNKDIIQSLQSSTKVLKQQSLSVHEVEDVIDDTRELYSQADEINDLLATPFRDESQYNEDELQEELESLFNPAPITPQPSVTVDDLLGLYQPPTPNTTPILQPSSPPKTFSRLSQDFSSEMPSSSRPISAPASQKKNKSSLLSGLSMF